MSGTWLAKMKCMNGGCCPVELHAWLRDGIQSWLHTVIEGQGVAGSSFAGGHLVGFYVEM